MVQQNKPTFKPSKGGKGKLSRNKRKLAGKATPLSLFIRGKISGETYFNQTKQTIKNGKPK